MGRGKVLAVVLGVIVAVGLVYWVVDEWYANRRASEALDQILATLPPGYDVTYDGAEASVVTGEVVVTGLRVNVDIGDVIAAYGVDLEELAQEQPGGVEDLDMLRNMTMSASANEWIISEYDSANNPPRYMTQEVKGFEFDFGKLFPEEAMIALEALFGNSKVTGNLRIRYVSDAETGDIDIPYYDIFMNDIGRIEFSGRFGGYHVWPEPDNPLAAMANMETMTVYRMELSYDDFSFFDRIIRLVAQENGLTPAEVKEQAVTMIGLSAAEIADERLQNASVALAKFVKDPGRITISLAPDKPVNFMEWSLLAESDPSAALDMVNFSVTNH